MIKTVYIASMYSKGDQATNVRDSILAAEKLREEGFLPYVPLLTHFWHFMSPHEYEYWTKMDLEWLPFMDCVLRLPGESSGADNEVTYMLDLGKPVFWSIGDLITYVYEKEKNEKD